MTDWAAWILSRCARCRFFDRYSRPYSRIVMYPFFFDLLSKMSDAAHERSTLKLHIAAVHDTVVMPLLVILGVSDGRWPPYASRLVFEVWRVPQIPKVGDLENYTFLRLLYHGMDITGRLACSNHPSTKKGFCSLATFRKQVPMDFSLGRACGRGLRELSVHLTCHGPVCLWQVQDMLGPFPTYEEACAKSASR